MRDAKLILDAGCGDLRFSKIVANNTNSLVISIDIDESIIRKGLESQRVENIIPIVCDIRKLPLRSNAFDGIIVINLLHHLPDLDSLLKALYEFRRVYKRNARILIKENVSNNPFRLLPEKLYNHMPAMPREVVIDDKCCTQKFTTEFLINAVTKCGF
jgi:ubiquinone/menaquinone biosynthesis C-methylase UbiE